MGPYTPAPVRAAVAGHLRGEAVGGPALPADIPEHPLPASRTPMPLPATSLQANPTAALVPPPQGITMQMTTLQKRVDDWYAERERLGLIKRPALARTGRRAPSEAFDPGTLHPEERDRLVRAQAVELTPLGNGVFVAHGTKDYTVDLNARSPFSGSLGRDIYGTCTCEDFQQRMGPAGLRCKHLLKAQMEAGALGVGAAEQVKEEFGSESEIIAAIQQTLGITDPPAPTFGDSPPARIDPTFEFTPEARRVLQFIGGALRMGYAQSERGIPTMDCLLYTSPSPRDS